MSDIDAAPHATPDQIRAAEKRAAAAREVEGKDSGKAKGDKSEARTAPPKGRRTPKGDEA